VKTNPCPACGHDCGLRLAVHKKSGRDNSQGLWFIQDFPIISKEFNFNYPFIGRKL
jgi:anaerobic selenocysteine-containing dehydrogenase